MLTAFSGGAAATALAEMTETEREALCMEELELLFPGIKQAATQTAFVSWPGERFTAGGYSCPAPGDVTKRLPALVEGFHPIHFSGEACSPVYWGFVQGALHAAVLKALQLGVHYGGKLAA